MFKFTNKNKQTSLEKEIESVIKQMSSISPESEGYTTSSENLERLYKAKAQERSCRVSPDTIAIVVGNLLGIVMILKFERADVITSKALGFVLKGRV